MQPNLGFRINEHFEIALSSKICYWQFSDYYLDYQRWEVDRNGDHYLIYEDKRNPGKGTQLIIEPALTLKAEWKLVKIEVQGGIYFSNDATMIRNPYADEEAFFLKAGVCFNLDFNKRKKQELKN